MLYSKCDIDFSAMGPNKPKTEEAIEFKGTLESAVHEVRMEAAIDQFFIVHEQCDFEEMALNAYVDAHGNEAILESSLTVIREAAEDQEKRGLIAKIKDYISKVPGLVSKALSTISEKLSGITLEKFKEKIKDIKNVKVEMPDFKEWADRIINAFNGIKIFEKILSKIKKGEKVTKEEINEEVAKATGGDSKGDSKALMNIEKPKEKAQNVDGKTFFDNVEKRARDISSSIEEAGKKVKYLLGEALRLIELAGVAVISVYAITLFVKFGFCLWVAGAFIGAMCVAVSAIWNAGKDAANAVSDKVHNATKKDEGNFSGETVEA